MKVTLIFGIACLIAGAQAQAECTQSSKPLVLKGYVITAGNECSSEGAPIYFIEAARDKPNAKPVRLSEQNADQDAAIYNKGYNTGTPLTGQKLKECIVSVNTGSGPTAEQLQLLSHGADVANVSDATMNIPELAKQVAIDMCTN